jgi:TolA-binding protein
MKGRVPFVGLLVAGTLLSSCAYYNTFYLARRYHDRANPGQPYPVEKPDPAATQNLNKSIEYSKKVIATYPTSKWVDDAYLLWAKALLGKDDPIQTVNMLRDFPARYPESPLRDEALFYYGVANRQARRYSDAVTAFEEFLRRDSKHDLAPYANYELARAFMALKRPAEAAEAASVVIERHPKSQLSHVAMLTRAEALMAQGEHERARADYQTMGARARTDEERFSFLLKEADAFEASRRFDEELALLRDAISHEREPAIGDTTAAQTIQVRPAGGAALAEERWGRLMVRIGTVYMLQGRDQDALASYRRVIEAYPRTGLAAEAQFRIGYVYETVLDDFESARAEYGRVRQQTAASQFAAQANQRLAMLDRLAQYRTAGGDSLARKAEAGFLLAEQYLFQLDKPDRALGEYRRIAAEHAGTPMAAKAMNAEAWVLRTRFQQPRQADSVLWRVIHDYPATEAQLAARDYLEAGGHLVAANLIVPPRTPAPPVDTAAVTLTPMPQGTIPLGPDARADSLRFGPRDPSMVGPAPPAPGVMDTTAAPVPADTTRRVGTPTPAPADSVRRPPGSPVRDPR